MTLYVKKPIPINAYKLDVQTWEIPAWLDGYIDTERLEWLEQGGKWRITTNHGDVHANDGDWLLQTPHGEIYPIEDTLFRETYDAVPTGAVDPALSHPHPGTWWTHTSGRHYVVLFLTNDRGDDDAKRLKYPVTVVYASENSAKWSRPLHDWHRSMTLRVPV